MTTYREGCPDRAVVERIQKAVGAEPADGIWGPKTTEALKRWQQARGLAADGIAGPQTMEAITAQQRAADRPINPQTALTVATLTAIMPAARAKYNKVGTSTRAEIYLPWLRQFCTAYGITTRLRLVYLLATVAVESGELKYSEEIASGAAYEGRKDLGNTQPGDGVRFKGRGLLQLTGRTNYEAYSKHVGYDFYSTTARARGVAQPGNAVRSACWYWQTHGLNELADQDAAQAVRKRVNGGMNGWAQFQLYVKRAKDAL